MSEEQDSRFRVYGKGDVVELHGSIGDTTNFSPLDEMIKADNILDCSGIHSASWLGILGLNRYINDRRGNFRLTNIPHKLYKFLRLLPECGKAYEVDMIEVATFRRTDVSAASELVRLTTVQLGTMRSDSGHDFVSLADNQAIAGQVSKLCPQLFSESSASPPYASPWCRENSDECFFWYSFLEFWTSTLGLSVDLIQSQGLGLGGLLGRIIARVENAEQGFAPVAPLGSTISERMKDSAEWIKEQCDAITSGIEESLRTCEAALRQLQIDGEDPQNTSGELVYRHLGAALGAIEHLGSFPKKIEEVGFQSGQKILSIDAVRFLKGTLLQIDGSELTQETIDEIREGFNIMDPFSDDDWPETKEKITDELTQIQNEIGNCVIVVQGFDLLRQVLEHRIAEADILQSSFSELKQGNADWQAIKEQLIAQITKTLVTDQEKYSFAFFLPKDYESYQSSDKKQPGDVMLF